MIKKENFVALMKAVKKQMEFDQNASKKLSEIFVDFEGWYDNLELIEVIFLFLEKEMNDEDEWIDYFVYEINWGKEWTENCCKNEDESIIDISTIEKLYDFLVENSK